MEKKKDIAIVGAGPAGLMAAEILAKAGMRVTIYERKTSPARKFLMAGRGGLNLTHSEPLDKFVTRYGAVSEWMADMIRGFTPDDLRKWSHDLGEETFVGSSGRVFPKNFKASPLLRAWLRRLESLGVTLQTGKTWEGWDKNGALLFNGEKIKADAVLLALGGASWPGLGSDGLWVSLLKEKNVTINDLRPANSGFVCKWSDIFVEKFAGQPLKSIALHHNDQTARGDIMIDRNGIEGGAIYALSSFIRTTIEQDGQAKITIDLRPEMPIENLLQKLAAPRDKKSFSNYLRTSVNFSPAESNFLREAHPDPSQLDLPSLASLIKAVPLTLTAPFSIDRAISSAGGITLSALDDNLMIKNLPGVFAAGEMLDWEAPTGGYLLQGCFATGFHAADGILRYLTEK